MFLFTHLHSKCNVFPSLDYVIANRISFEDNATVAKRIILTRIQLALDKPHGDPHELVEFFSRKYL